MLDEEYRHLVDAVAQSGFAVLAVMIFPQAASERFLDFFNCDFCIEPCLPYWVAMLSSVISLVETVDVCAILDGFKYDIGTAFMAREVIRLIDWLVVKRKPVAQLLSFSHRVRHCLCFFYRGCRSADPR